MTLTDIIIKVLLFFGVFYGAIVIAAYVGKKFREGNKEDENTNISNETKD